MNLTPPTRVQGAAPESPWGIQKAVMRKEWRRLSRSLFGRTGPALLLAICVVVVAMQFLLFDRDNQFSISPMKILSGRSSEDHLVGFLIAGFMVGLGIATLGALQVLDLLHKESATGTLHTLRLSPLPSWQTVVGKMLSGFAQQGFMLVVIAPVLLVTQSVMGLPGWYLPALFIEMVFFSLVLTGTGVGSLAPHGGAGMLWRARSAILGSAVLSMALLVPTAMFTKAFFSDFSTSEHLLLTLVLLLLGFTTWMSGVISASRRLFYPSATGFSVGQMGVFSVLILGLLLLVTHVVLARNPVTRVGQDEAAFTIIPTLAALLLAWFTLAQTLHGRGGLDIKWTTLDGRFASLTGATLVVVVILAGGFLLGPALVLPTDSLGPVLGVMFFGLVLSVFWLVLITRLALMVARKSTSPVRSVGVYVALPVMGLMVFLNAYRQETTFPAQLIPFTYVAAWVDDGPPVMDLTGGMTQLRNENGLVHELSGSQTLSMSTGQNPLALTGQGKFLLMFGSALLLPLIVLLLRAPLPLPKTPPMPKDFKYTGVT